LLRDFVEGRLEDEKPRGRPRIKMLDPIYHSRYLKGNLSEEPRIGTFREVESQ
jgi:hypothetical protein